jgi:hypothetical protein
MAPMTAAAARRGMLSLPAIQIPRATPGRREKRVEKRE